MIFSAEKLFHRIPFLPKIQTMECYRCNRTVNAKGCTMCECCALNICDGCICCAKLCISCCTLWNDSKSDVSDDYISDDVPDDISTECSSFGGRRGALDDPDKSDEDDYQSEDDEEEDNTAVTEQFCYSCDCDIQDSDAMMCFKCETNICKFCACSEDLCKNCSEVN